MGTVKYQRIGLFGRVSECVTFRGRLYLGFMGAVLTTLQPKDGTDQFSWRNKVLWVVLGVDSVSKMGYAAAL